ncbi:ABC transporter permease [Pseudomonas oryziphila]|uniref:FtsX-like permease family protein n=1 Tax=Pseudomonas oryziphila TaxID=2894079 RepID=A0ABN5TH98_9PSED|nr:FtsX-like permease family protein [Pseudomonas oryziphila]AZL73737.1 FtsX-like permease family protein [Pseudomonas oryziphila]
MSMLTRHVLRSVRSIRYRLLTIAMICASTFGVVAGAYSSIDSLFDTVEQIQSASAMADLELVIGTEDQINVPRFSDLPTVAQVHQRLLSPGLLPLGQAQATAALLVSMPAEDFSQVNRLALTEGRLPAAGDNRSVVVERNCAAYHHLGIGAQVDFQAGQARYPLTVTGIAQSPEYLVAPLNPAVYVPTNGSLCVLYADRAVMADSLGFEAVNSLLLGMREGSDPVAFKAEVTARAQTRLAVDYAMTRQEQFSQKFLELDLNTFKVFLPTVVLIFAVSSTLVVFFLMYQWAREEQPLIAMFLTLGYHRRQVLLAYSLPVLLLMLVAAVAGLALALFDMYAFGVNYAKAIGMPSPALAFKPAYLASAVGVLVTTILAGMYLPMREILRITPMDALRDQGASREQPLAMRLVELARRVPGPFWFRYALRNLLRSWRISLVTLLAMSASIAITIAFYISLTSMERTAIGNVERDQWSRVVDLDAPWWNEDLARLEDAVPGSRWSTFVKGGAQIADHDKLDNAFLLGIEPADEVRHVNLTEGRMLAAGDDQTVVLERRLAASHGIVPGASVQLRVRGSEYPATVVGVFSGAVPGEVIAPRGFAQRMLGLQEQFTGAYLLAGSDGREVNDAGLYREPGVVRVTSRQDIVAAILQISGHIWVIIHISALMSIIIALLFTITSTNFAIVGRRAEYGVLRILGFSDRTVCAVMYGETLMIALGAALVAVPLGFGLGFVLNHRLADVWFKINTDPALADFLRVLVPALLFIPLAAFPAVRHVLRIDAVDTLKLRNFG